MEFRLLGQIGCVDPAIPLAGRQHALLGMLLMHAPDAVAIGHLLDALWPDGGPAGPANALQSRVSKLRRRFEEAGVRDIVVRQGAGYALHIDPASIDARRFEALAADARQLLHAGDLQRAAERASMALDLWSGPAMTPLADEPWARPEAVRLEEQRLATIEDHATAMLRLGRHAEMVADLERHVAMHPLREQLRGQLMLALYRCGRQADALAVHQRGRELLADELGIDPSPAMTTLHRRILEQSPHLDAPSDTAPRRAASAGPMAGSVTDQPRLVGRARELATLTAAMDLTDAGRSTVVLVTGDAGVGKSELLRSVAAHADDDGRLVAIGRCAEVPGTPSYWPWMQVVRSIIERLEPDRLAAASATVAGELARFVPEIADRLPALQPDFVRETTDDPYRLQHAVSRFVRQVGDQQPLVLVIEDIHRADLASLGVLDRVSADLADSRVLLAISARSTGTALQHERDGALAALLRRGDVQRLELRGLDHNEVAALAARTAGSTPTDAMSRALYERSGGNPLFVLELVRSLGHRELDDAASAALLAQLPPALREVIAARLAQLPDDTRTCLDAAAILGRDVSAELVARMLDRPLAQVADALQIAIDAGVLEATPQGWFGASRFTHALVRDALEAELSPVRRAQLHAAAGTALTAIGADDHATTVAHHLELAVPLIPPGDAADAMVTAADQAMAVLANDDASSILERALALLERHGPDRHREIRLRSRLVTLATMSEGFTSPRTRAAVERIRALSGQVGDAPEIVGSLWSQWAYWANSGRVDLAAELAAELLDGGLELDDAAAIAAGRFAVGQTAFLQGEPGRAAEHLEHCHRVLLTLSSDDIARRGLGLLALNGRCALAHPLWLAGRTDEADRLARAAVDRADLGGDDYAAAHTRMFMAWYRAATDDAEDALAWSTDAVARGESGGFRLVIDLAGAFAGWATAVTGDPAAGVDRLWASMEGLRRAGFTMLRSWHLELLARSLLAGGRHEEAKRMTSEAIAVAERTSTTFHLASHHLAHALVLASAGAADDAERSLATAGRIAADQRSPTLMAMVAAADLRP